MDNCTLLKSIDNLEAGLSSPSLGIDIPKIQVTTDQIKSIREKMNISQTVFAKILNVSPSSIRQWEQGKRTPSGSTKVLLELLETSPHLLDYRLKV